MKKNTIIILFLFIAFKAFGQTNKISKILSNNEEIDSLIKAFDYDSVEKKLQNSIDLAKEINLDSIFAIVFESHAKYYYYTGDYEKTSNYLIKSAKIYDEIGQKNKAIKMYNNIAAILSSIGSFNKALKIRKKILTFKETDKDLLFKTSVLSNIGSDYRKQNLNDSAFYYINFALKISKKNHFKGLIGANYQKLQKVYLDLKQYDLSIKYGDSTFFYKEAIERPLYENAIVNAANALYEVKQYDASLNKCNLAIELIKQSRMLVNLPQVYELKSKIYESQNNFKLANLFLKKRNNLKDSILTTDKQEKILELEQKYQTEKKEKENLKLIQEASEKDLTIAKKNNYLLFGSLIFSVIVISLIIYQLRKFKNKNEALQRAIEKREQIENELEIVRDNIAKDFHDDLGNKLARITVLSEYMIQSVKNWNKSKIIEALKKINLDADILYKGTRDFMFSLKAKSDFTEELFTYLSDFGDEFFQSFNIDFYVEKKLDLNKKLPYYWNRQIIMIFKEAMTNAAKHSHSTTVKLTMKIKNNDLDIIFEDNGIGFNFDKISSKNGLSNMQLRAEKMNVLLTISSSKKGTKISLNAKISN
ncbi:hypothetical protein IU405_12070 [Polaribacter sp. BAL334]|uniref:tetratricopeptide repeat-containing sensor histidine kinase n=1 Tax=Polaribacter sp. BAL334 TaxID=1708178 RepID=UPI0018D22D36|nr:ATP-binding protein [Polaribacter sp. BAL334]MBG7612984.1 hypothetical protein [Polaribacter sp. BAL334]